MRGWRALVAIGVALVVAAAAVGVGVRGIRERLSSRATRLIAFLVDDLFASRGTWRVGREAPTSKMEAQSVVVGGKLYVFGGFAGTTPHSMSPVEPRVSVYDPVADTWSRAADMPIDVTHCYAVVVDGTVWIAGGFQGPHPGVPVANVLRYDVASNSWSQGPPLPVPTAGGTLALVDRTLHYVGGFTDRDTTVDRHWALALAGGTKWEPRAPLPVARGHVASAVVGGRVYAIGGQQRHDTDPIDLDVVHAYDPARDAWTTVASLPAPRSHFEASTFVHHGRIVIVGGRNNRRMRPLNRVALSNISAYDPATNAWTELPALPMALQSTCAQVIDDRLIVTNGCGMDGVAGQDLTFIADFR